MEKIKLHMLKYKSIIAYGIVGGVVTLVNIALYYFFVRMLKIDYLFSVALAFILATLLAFWGNKYIVFESKTQGTKAFFSELVRFFGARLVMGGFDVTFMYVTVSYLSWSDMPMKIISNIIVIICNYIISKLFVFKER